MTVSRKGKLEAEVGIAALTEALARLLPSRGHHMHCMECSGGLLELPPGHGVRGLTKDEKKSIAHLLQVLDDGNLLDALVEEKIAWWSATWPSRLVKAIKKGLRSTEAIEAPVEFQYSDDGDHELENGALVHRWARDLTAAAKKMVKLWTIEDD